MPDIPLPKPSNSQGKTGSIPGTGAPPPMPKFGGGSTPPGGNSGGVSPIKNPGAPNLTPPPPDSPLMKPTISTSSPPKPDASFGSAQGAIPGAAPATPPAPPVMPATSGGGAPLPQAKPPAPVPSAVPPAPGLPGQQNVVQPAGTKSGPPVGAQPAGAPSAGQGKPQPGSGQPASSQPPAPQPAGVKKNPLASITKLPMKVILMVVAGLIIVGGLAFAAYNFLGGGDSTSVVTTPPAGQGSNRQTVPSEQVKLTYWGLWETSAVFEDLLREFETANPGVTVEYQKQNHPDYRERLQTAIASQSGPDLFRYHASWTPMLQQELAALPTSVMSAAEYKETFYPVTSFQLQANGQIVGIPLMYDGLGLYINSDFIRAAGATPPETWAELKTLASQLTVRSGNEIERGGLAIGNASNVEHFSDIIGLLLIQNGADPANPTSKEAQEALQFYTNFFIKDKVWSDKLPSSTVAFARGDVAMMFAPSWRALEVKAINPDLKMEILPVPKLGSEQIGWASYWAEGVNGKSKNKEMAWKLLKFLSSQESLRKLSTAQSNERLFGELYPRVDMAGELSGDVAESFLKDAPYARSWFLNSYTHDNGINDQIIKYYEDAVNAVVNEGKQVKDVMQTVSQGTKQVLRQYGAGQ